MTLADCTVMVVEDHEFQRRTTLQILANLGAGTLLEAADGEQALALLASQPRPDIVICDLDMPNMDGVEFLRHLSEWGTQAAIVIASGLDGAVLRSAEETARGYGLEILGAIRKPLTARMLLRAVGLHRPAPPARPAAADGNEDAWTEALRDGRVVVRASPRVDLATGHIGGVEIRAHRFDVAAGTVDAAGDPRCAAGGEVAVAIAALVVRAGLAAQRQLGEAGRDVNVTLVLPPGALADAASVDWLTAMAAEAAVPPGRVSVALPDTRDGVYAAPLDVLTRLRVRGFGLSLDGFGTTRATLQKLEQLPLTEVKIAADAVGSATASEGGAEAFAATVQSLRDRGLDVVCAGCDSQAEWLLALQGGCRRAQGALVSAPIAPEDLVAWRASWSGVG